MITLKRHFTQKDVDVYSQVTWKYVDAVLFDNAGNEVFKQTQVEVPAHFSQLACDIVISKYFHEIDGQRETSMKQMFERIVSTFVLWAKQAAVFGNAESYVIFAEELRFILVWQYATFNSPVWFNMGTETKPQCSACFINSVDDSMQSILDLGKIEGLLFKYGSGTGSNFSRLRASSEKLKQGGTSSGPVGFMKALDAFAGVIKSGGKTRRAAKMAILDCDHPDIETFIQSKALEEKKAWALIAAGYDSGVEGEAYGSVFFQNSNHSVRVTDAFMQAAVNDGSWSTYFRLENRVAETYKARALLHEMAEAAHLCGDPGLQFTDTIQRFHTCKISGKIEASNPCSEYVFLNDTACNLASLNLLQFLEGEEFALESFIHVIEVMLLCQELCVDNASYPTPAITENSKRFRPLGLGYANLGAFLMAQGLPYDSDEARTYAACLTALLTGAAYRQSARFAEHFGSFAAYAENKQSMQEVIVLHQQALQTLQHPLRKAAEKIWDEVLNATHGFRNAQVTVLAPTGTIGFMLDCQTMGIEPDIQLVKYKKLVGGGQLKITNQTVEKALLKLGYAAEEITAMLEFLALYETLENAPHLKPEHYAVFDCALKPRGGTRFIQPLGHLKMMASVQPFLSGAISKTVNLPTETSIEDIQTLFIQAWQLQLKSIAVYRDGSKKSQPLNTLNEHLPCGPTSCDGE